MTNCILANNSAARGGGLYFSKSNPMLINCIIRKNVALKLAYNAIGDGIYCYDSTPVFTNCIIWDNDSEQIYVETGSPDIRYCDVEGGWEGVGNIDIDPLFTSGPYGDCYLSQIAAGQESDSPCIDAGSDLAGNICFSLLTTICVWIHLGQQTGRPKIFFIDSALNVTIINFACFVKGWIN